MKYVITTIVIVMTLALVASADVGDQLHKLTASDAAMEDYFGNSVAISSNTAIVGARGNDDAGFSSGSAYLFNATTGNQLTKLTASDAAEFDYFGRSVAISGNTALVGASWDDDAGDASGSAYLFNATTASQLFKLTASDAAAYDYFGHSVAISGNTAIVGAYGDDDAGSGSGSAYLFNATTGSQLAKLTASDAAASDRFGQSVAISGNTAIVGALYNDDGGPESGSAYLFEAPEPLAGDFDLDNDVDGIDFSLWQAGYPTASGATLGNGDADGDGDVDGVDFGIWQAAYPTAAPAPVAGSTAIPEPTTLALFLIGSLALLRRPSR